MIVIIVCGNLPGTLPNFRGYGAGNPREIVSRRAGSLLKFNPLKLKGLH